MARKSRVKSLNTESNISENKIFKTGIYARLSNENIIENQIEYCKNYISKHNDLKLVNIYSDNGFTGTNFNRPAFKSLIEDIKSGEINCILTKDLSRLGRNYIDISTFIEIIFPNLEIRFISINENYDTLISNRINDNLSIPFQNIINEFYSKDISKKVYTTAKINMLNGTFKNSNLPYGYMWNDEHTQIIVDKKVAPYIKMIFKWKIAGKSSGYMKQRLNDLNAPSINERKNELGIRNSNKNTYTNWSYATLNAILKNHIYTGNTVHAKREIAKFKNVHKTVKNQEKDWIIHHNTHEAIISSTDFQTVQDIMLKSSKDTKSRIKQNESERNNLINLFENKLFCGDCNKKMNNIKKKYPSKWVLYFNCGSFIKKSKNHCKTHHIQQNELIEKVLNAINLNIYLNNNFINSTNIDKNIINDFIEKVKIYEDKKIEILFRYNKKIQ